jgi:hypothetical protein
LLIAAGTSNADLPVGCSVDLPVHAFRYTNWRIALILQLKIDIYGGSRAFRPLKQP